MLYFCFFFTVIGAGIVFGAPEGLTTLFQIIAAWSPTLALLILFKRIYPGMQLMQFAKNQFSGKIRLPVLGTVVVIQVMITVSAMLLLSVIKGASTIFSFMPIGMIILAFLNDLVRGPLGEELGWRGYALNELQKKYSPLKSSIVVGVLWGFWHTPLWIASGYTGVDLVVYSSLFMIGIVSFSVIVTLFYNLNKNLIIPIVMHQLFNFSLVLIRGDLLEILEYVMPLYFAIAVVVIVINPKEILYKKVIKGVKES